MISSDLITALLASASIALGALFGVLGNWLISEYKKSGWAKAFYIIGGLTLIFPIIVGIIYWEQVSNWLGILAIFLSITGSMCLLIFIKRKVDTKNIYKTSEIDPIINEFSERADSSEIKLFGGDLSFFGESERKIDENAQYIKLKSRGFNHIQIICEQPVRNETKFRYGKIISDLPQTELRFYDPEAADLRIRGRIAKVGGADRLLMFNKLQSQLYQIIQTDTANSNGALYNNIWSLIWDLARRPNQIELESFVNLYSEGK